MPRIVQETRFVNKTRVVKKLDKMSLFQIKKKVNKFMAEGRTEFNVQLLKWQELFEETNDDYYEYQSRVEKLEAMVELLATQLEAAEDRAREAETKIQLHQEQLDGHETFLIELEEDYDPTEQKESLHEPSAMSSEIPLDNSSMSQDSQSKSKTQA